MIDPPAIRQSDRITVPLGTEAIIHLDDWCVAINKPSGLLVHRSDIDRHETRFAVQEVRDLLGRRVYPVHRLDRGTSGVLLFALDPDLAGLFSQALQNDQTTKTYLAVVRGYLPAEGRIDTPLRDPFDPYLHSGGPCDRPLREAVTRFHCLAQAELPHRADKYPCSRYSLARVDPLSGRRHQIRRHLKSIAHPIIGDSTYGKGNHNRLFRDLFASDRLLLHAHTMHLVHPVSGASLQLQAPLDANFARVCVALGWSAALAQAGQTCYVDGL